MFGRVCFAGGEQTYVYFIIDCEKLPEISGNYDHGDHLVHLYRVRGRVYFEGERL